MPILERGRNGYVGRGFFLDARGSGLIRFEKLVDRQDNSFTASLTALFNYCLISRLVS